MVAVEPFDIGLGDAVAVAQVVQDERVHQRVGLEELVVGPGESVAAQIAVDQPQQHLEEPDLQPVGQAGASLAEYVGRRPRRCTSE